MANSLPLLSGLDLFVTLDEEAVNLTPQLIDADVTFLDADNNFEGGTLLLSGAVSEDILAIRNQGTGAGQIGVDGSDVTYEGTVIGTVTGGTGGVALSVTFNASANSAGIEALIENLTYQNLSDTPTGSRTLELTITDAAGAHAVAPVVMQAVTGAANPFNGIGVVNNYNSAPAFADLDGDGDLDAVIGDWYGSLNYFENTGTGVAPAYVARTGAANPFDGVDVGFSSTPSFADLEGDGDLDAVIGEVYGTLKYFENTGTGVAPAYVARTGAANPFDGIGVGFGAAPGIADLDSDGDLDAVIGEAFGTLRYFENAGTGVAPIYAELTGAANPFNGIDVDYDSKPAFADLDGDGDLDAMVGERFGTLKYFENTGTVVAPAYVERIGAANPFDGVDVGQYALPSFADLDGDGDPDAAIGGNLDLGTLIYFENTQTPVSAVDEPVQFLERTGAANPFNGIDAGSYSAPAFADLDGDGDLDAVVGEYYSALRYYENTGTGVAPVYVLRTGAADPFDGINFTYRSTPAFADLDDDGDLDAMVGQYDGTLVYFENTGAAAVPAYVYRTGAADPFNGIDVGHNIKPSFADLDGDGDLDAVIGEDYDHSLDYYENTGTGVAPVYVLRTGAADPFDGIDVGNLTAPAFVDLDRDGDLDAVIGEYLGTLKYFENTGDGVVPTYVERTGGANPFNGISVGSSSTPAFADLDGDGDLDAVIGKQDGVLNYYENTGPGGFQFVLMVTQHNDPPVAFDDTLAAVEDTPVTYAAADLVGNDTDVEFDTLVIDSVTSASGGTAVLNGDGTVTFTPGLNFNGPADFTYVVSDGTDTAEGAVTVNVAAVNDAAVITGDTTGAVTEDGTLIASGDLNVTDVDGPGEESFVAQTNAVGTYGDFSVDTAGAWDYDLTNASVQSLGAGDSATDIFTVASFDGTTQDVTITITGSNDAPVANDDTLGTSEGYPITYPAAAIVGNDTDVDLDTLSILSVDGPGALLNGDGSVTFDMGPDFNGLVSFDYVVSDGFGGTDSGIVFVTVAALNDVPVGYDDFLSGLGTEDLPLTIPGANLVANDFDIDSDPLSILSVASVFGGTAVLNLDQSVTVTPDLNFNGQMVFTYVVKDSNDASNGADVHVVVDFAAVNDPPVAYDETLAATEDTPVTYAAADLVGNDTDIENDTLFIQDVAGGEGGAVALNGDGTVTFTPDANFNGPAYFIYTVSDGTDTDSGTVFVNVAPVNDPPVAFDDTLAAVEDTPVTYAAADLVGNDTDVEFDTLVIDSVTSASGGTAVLNGDGTVTFTPGLNFNGPADFTYVVSDGTDTAEGAVTVNVAAVNDAAVITGDTTGAVTEDGTLIASGDLNVTDVDGPGEESFVAQTNAVGTYGDFSVDTAGAWDYDLTNASVQSLGAGDSATDIFTVASFDGTTQDVTITITGSNDAPVANDDTLGTSEGYPITYPAAAIVGNDTDVDLDTLSILSVDGPGALLNGDGSVTFDMGPDFNGLVSFDYVVSDGFGGTDSGIVFVTVAALNDVPVGYDDFLSGLGTEDLPLTIPGANLVANDFDIDSDPLSILSVASVFGGTAVLNLDQSVTVTPDLNFNGQMVFTYVVKDSNDASNGADVHVVVDFAAVNDPPVAYDETLAATEDTPVTYAAADLVGNDTDIENDTLFIQDVAGGEGGAVALNGDGTVTFTPDANFNGPAYFIYTVSDGTDTDSGTVFVNVAPVNDPPVAFDDTLAAVEDTPVTYAAADLVGNDTDVEFDTLVIDSVTSASGGTAVLNGDGTVTFTPGLNFNGPADFTYVVSDGLDTDTGAVTVNVAAVNDAPVAYDDELFTFEDSSVTFATFQLLGNDMDVDIVTPFVDSVTSGTGGTVVLNGNGTFTFTPNLNFNGTADFTYVLSDGIDTDSGSVTVNVAAVNDAPVAGDDTLAATEDTPATYAAADLLGNDTDVELDSLFIGSVTSGTGGWVVLNGDGTVTFTPYVNYNGTADFTYGVIDGNGGIDSGAVTMIVAAVNDAPVAVDDVLAATEDTPVNYLAAQLVGNDMDEDVDTLTIDSVTSGTGGAAVLELDGTVTFTPDEGFTGAADFTYVVSDGNGGTDEGAVTVSVTPPNNPPVAGDDTVAATEDTPLVFAAVDLLDNDTDVEPGLLTVTAVGNAANGTVSLVGGQITFTPGSNFNGTADFTYVVSDGEGGTDSGTVFVNVSAVNDAPVANDDFVFGTEDTPVTYTAADIVGNDTDVDLDTLFIESVASPGFGGTAVLNGDGTVTFTPDLNFNGPTGFQYFVSDGNGGTDDAVFQISVFPVNDAPVANDDTLAATEDTPVTYAAADLLGNDTDVDLDTLTIDSVTSGTGGTVVLNGDGTVTFTPTLNFNGTAGFTYVVSDGTDTDGGGVTVNVAAVNDAPVANDDTLEATEDTPLEFAADNLVGNDTDVEDDTLTVIAVGNAVNGTVSLDAGNILFTPGSNFNGTASFEYTLSDGTDTVSGDVAVDVAAVNDAPVALDDTLAAIEDTPINYPVGAIAGNDSDDDNDTLSIQSVTSGTGGTAVLELDGSVTFTPNLNFNGPAGFTYVVSDGTDTDSGAVTVNVAAVNDAPVANDDTLAATEDTPVNYTAAQIVGNDTDVDLDTLVFEDLAGVDFGSVVLELDGTITFAPDSNFNGQASFNYVVSDGEGGTDTGAVTVNVAAVNDAPTVANAIADQPATQINNPFNFTFAANTFADAEGDSLTYTATQADDSALPTWLTFTPGTRSFSGTPLEGDIDVVDVKVTASDGNGGTNSEVFTVAVVTDNDTLTGGAGDDVLSGGTGNDTLTGAAGNDTLDGGAGNDVGFGSAGDDSLQGGLGNDNLQGNAGVDTLIGNAGNDTLDGGADADLAYGSVGDDSVLGGAGIDTLVGNAGNDTLNGGTEDDQVFGSVGNDYVLGGLGADVVQGNAGNDTVIGGDGTGTDTLDGNDSLDGGGGDDSLFGGFGADNVLGGAGFDTLIGNAGNDTLDGGADGDLAYGSAGDDSILGGAGIDTLVGNANNDTIDGGADDDQVFGSIGDDVVAGGAGNDVVSGNAGNDTVVGGAGNDTMQGNVGTDTFRYDAATLNTLDVAAGQADFVTANAAGDLISMLGLNDELTIGNVALSALTANALVGNALNATNNIAFTGGVLQIDLDGNDTFNALNDFQVQLTGVTSVTYNSADDQFHLA